MIITGNYIDGGVEGGMPSIRGVWGGGTVGALIVINCL